MNSKSKSNILRVAFPSKQAISSYEPTNISLDFEYIFLENVFSPLVEINQNGVIEPGVAEKIEWIGDELKLSIRPNLKTASGKHVTVADALFSLKRLLVLSGNTHGNFKDLVCPGLELKSVDQECPGLRIDKNDLYIKATGGKSFLLTMLSAIDFAVIPQSSVDPKTLKITSFAETSGVFYVDHQDADGSVHLKLNPSHYHAMPGVAEQIILVPTDSTISDSSFKLLESGQVDHLTTVDQSRIDHVVSFLNKNKNDFNGHITQKIRTSFLVFSSRGLSELSKDERYYVGSKVKDAFVSIYKDLAGFEPRAEFFPHLSEGGLNDDQIKHLSRKIPKLDKVAKDIKLGLMKAGALDFWSNPISEKLPNANQYRENNFPDFKKFEKIEDMPHAVIGATDTGFLEDIGLITYTLNSGLLGLSKSERQIWLAKYMSNDDKSERIAMLKDLHFEALDNVILVPLMSFPYTALVRKPWKFELSELYANNQLWRIKNN